MLRKSLAATVGLGFFAVAFVLLAVAFSTSSWTVSDYRGSDDRLGLWTHCNILTSDPNSIYFGIVECRWQKNIFNPYTKYGEIPGFMVATQSFFTICLIFVSMGAVFSLFHFLCYGSDMNKFGTLIDSNFFLTIVGGVCGAIAVIVFASFSNHNGWMPGHYNYSFGWSFVLACLGVICSLIASSLFFTDRIIHQKKMDKLKDILLILLSIITKRVIAESEIV